MASQRSAAPGVEEAAEGDKESSESLERNEDAPREARPTETSEPASPERNRRQFTRVPVEIEVDVRSSDTFLFAYIRDISEMGIFVQTDRPEVPGTRLHCCFRAVSGQLLTLLGEVIWVNPVRRHDVEGRTPGMGIQFVELGDDERRELLRLVRTFAYLDDDQPAEDTVGPAILDDDSDSEQDDSEPRLTTPRGRRTPSC